MCCRVGSRQQRCFYELTAAVLNADLAQALLLLQEGQQREKIFIILPCRPYHIIVTLSVQQLVRMMLLSGVAAEWSALTAALIYWGWLKSAVF